MQPLKKKLKNRVKALENLFCFFGKIATSTSDRILELSRFANNISGADNSFAGEFEHLKRLVSDLDIQGGYIVDIAASDGYTQSSTFGFFSKKNWSGLAVEMDPDKFSKLAFVYSQFPTVQLARNKITPHNIKDFLASFDVPKDYDLLNLDIDSYDLYVLEEMLKSGYRPKIISMEINEKIPPPIYFTVEYDENHYWQVDHFYGCSIEAAVTKVKPFGYILQAQPYNNAVFVRTDINNNQFPDLAAKAAYDSGYKNKADRKLLFPWNADMECLLQQPPEDSIQFLDNYFKKYSGKYTLKITS